MAEPGALAASVLAGADGGALDGFGKGQLAVEVGQGFGVADAGEGGEGAVVAAVAEAAGFVEEAAFEHSLGALGDALGEDFRSDLEAEDVGRDWGDGSGLDWARGLVGLGFGDFEGADEAAGVVEVDGGGAVGGEVAQALDEGLGAAGFEFTGEAAAQVGIGRRGAERGRGEQGLDVEAGAADDDGARSARLDVDDRGAGHACEAVGVEDLVWVNYVNQMVGCAFSFGECWLGGADVEAAVDLAGVGGDDFDRRVFGQLKCKAGFAGGGGAGDDEEGRALGFLSCVQKGASTFDRVMCRNRIPNVPTAWRHATRKSGARRVRCCCGR